MVETEINPDHISFADLTSDYFIAGNSKTMASINADSNVPYSIYSMCQLYLIPSPLGTAILSRDISP